MSTPFLQLFGVRRPELPSLPRLPAPLFWALMATIAAFFAGNVYEQSAARIFNAGKWAPLALLFIVARVILQRRRKPDFPVAIAIPLAILLFIALLSAWSAANPTFSLITILTVTATIATGYTVSAAVVASDSRRAFFEVYANVGRVLILTTALFFAAGINLGRSNGLSAWIDNPNTLAAMLAPSMVVFMAGCIEGRRGWAIWHAAFFMLGFVLIWETNARAAIAWLGFAGIAFWIYRRGVAITSIGLMIALVVLIAWWDPIKQGLIDVFGLNWSIRDGRVSPLSGREEVWRIGWHLFEERPLLGYGAGSSSSLIDAESWRFINFQGGHFHSSYIMAMVETGILGLLALLAVIVFAIGRGMADTARTHVLPKEAWPLAALPFAMMVGSVGHAIFEAWLLNGGATNTLFFWTCVAMIYHQAQIPIRATRARARPPLQQALQSPGALPTQ